MKRSEMLSSIRNRLLGTEINHEMFEHQILDVVEELGMIPPSSWKLVPFETDGKQYPLVPGDFKLDDGKWYTPGLHGWESE